MESIRVKAKVYFPPPAVALPLEKRPLKGRFAHIPYSSEDFIKERREENEREERRWEEEGI